MLKHLASLLEHGEDFNSPFLLLRAKGCPAGEARVMLPVKAARQTPTTDPPQSIQLDLENQAVFRASFPAQVPRPQDAIFVLGIKKCGSSLFNVIVQRLCLENNVGYVSLPDQAFQQNLHFAQLGTSSAFGELFHDGWIYGGYRQVPDFLTELSFFRSRRKLLLVRDPRDALVSEYFSVAYSHALPPADPTKTDGVREGLLRRREKARSQTVDEFVLQAWRSFYKQIAPMIPLRSDPLLTVYRYEDVVLDKRPWIIDLALHLNLALPPSTLASILADVDVIPSKERPNEFVRRVVPGDHRDKLTSSTIALLDHHFVDFLNAFGYC
ncbi:sulfotransferase domain-containing protein [Synechococcus sp. CBW1107]|uniref:sulfotransferase domain-containing protein n=1 Tax=Synechococcus sp. CBW1107 TaxID=2789857 RepID=UPI002AD51761|nr:sulfotransferase domain-containing protein [Synechococcus sp. CBW1107]